MVKTGRVMLGETNPFDSKPGTIRGDLCVQVGRYVLKRLISSKDTKCPVVCHDICRNCAPSFSILCTELPFPVPVSCYDLKMGVELWSSPLTETTSRAGTAHSLPITALQLLTTSLQNGDHFKKRSVLCFEFEDDITAFISTFSFPRNIIHGSDSVESAETEINLWFTPDELVDYRSCAHEWIYE